MSDKPLSDADRKSLVARLRKMGLDSSDDPLNKASDAVLSVMRDVLEDADAAVAADPYGDSDDLAELKGLSAK